MKSPVGAYGFRLIGAPIAHLSPTPAHWPELHVTVTDCVPSPGPAWVGPAQAEMGLSGGVHARLDRATMSLELGAPGGLDPESLAHPYLAAPAGVFNWWMGRDPLHAGVVSIERRAWGVLGRRGDGKTSVVATLSCLGAEILADDMAIVDEIDGVLSILAGPRLIDLHADAAPRYPDSTDIGFIGTRQRWRISLGSAPPATPLAGWITLRWGERTSVEQLNATDRLRTLASLRGSFLPPTNPQRLLAIGAQPMLRLTRPSDWSSHDNACRALLDAMQRGNRS